MEYKRLGGGQIVKQIFDLPGGQMVAKVDKSKKTSG